MAYLALFLAISGAMAYAADRLGKNTVGTRQLKRNSVTKAKLRKNSVVTAKIRNGAVIRKKLRDNAVNGAKIADGSVTGTEIDVASTPFSRIVHEARGNAVFPIPKSGEGPGIYPLGNNTYTQEPNRDDYFVGALDVTFAPACEGERQVMAFVVLDPANPAEPDESDVVGFGVVSDESGGEVSKRIDIGPYLGGSFQRDVPTNHALYLGAQLECEKGNGATATYGAVDVIGTK